VRTTICVHQQRAERLNEFYVKHRLTGRPFATAKFAISLDGKVATRTGESRWISGEESRQHAHRLRHQHDAILVGINTVVADDPELTARLDGQDPRVVGANTVIATTKPGRVGLAEVLELPPTPDGRVSLPDLLDELGRRNILSVLIEGGAEVHAAFFGERLVDKVYAYIAPRLVGGRDAPGALGGDGIARLSEAAGLMDVDVTRLGADVMISGYVHRDR
jgi:diaminohydroxyphosphoribosylaminopyrimidine deaminase/5-amino-6-(5-phosphoribosylamino)uracil reductase